LANAARSDASPREGAAESAVANAFRLNTNRPVYISGGKMATHGQVIRVLDLVRREGIQKVSFAITPGKD